MAQKQPNRNKLKRITGWLADTPLPAIALIATFVLTRWWSNSDFAYPAEVLVPIVLFAGLVSLIFYGYRWWLVKRFKTVQALQPYKVLLFALLFIFVVQLGRSGWRLIEVYGPLTYSHPAPSLPQPAQAPASKPDIYYLVV